MLKIFVAIPVAFALWVLVFISESYFLENYVYPMMSTDRHYNEHPSVTEVVADVLDHPERYQVGSTPVCVRYHARLIYYYHVCVNRIRPVPEGNLYRQVVWLMRPTPYSRRLLFGSESFTARSILAAYINDNAEPIY